MIIQGDCLDVLKTLEFESIDAIVTDPPAGIAFMGKDWDKDKGGRDNWIAWMQEIAVECLRVIKPGGHAFIWALPRTSHWTATAWENAGFEVRDRIAFVFGSGFPKSLDVGKAVDKLQGNERGVVGVSKNDKPNSQVKDGRAFDKAFNKEQKHETILETKGTSKFEGFGTALKPAVEDWWLLRKPLSEKTVAENCLKHGCGALNIDGSRIGTDAGWSYPNGRGGSGCFGKDSLSHNLSEPKTASQGRWPSNLILEKDCPEVLACFPETKSGAMKKAYEYTNSGNSMGKPSGSTRQIHEANEGSAARFFKQCEITDEDRRIFYTAKPSKKERNAGCEELEKKYTRRDDGQPYGMNTNTHRPDGTERKPVPPKQNFHPTIKALSLMKYLINMISREGQIVLDPFAGSGTTGLACQELNRKFILIEKEPEYIEIIKQRLQHNQSLFSI